MKNQQINKFLLIFFLSFTLFFSVSTAEFSTSSSTQWTSMSSAKVTNISYGDYTGTQVRDILKDYVSDTSNTQYSDAFNNLCSYLDGYGYDVYLYSYVYKETSTLRYYYMGVVKKGLAEFGISYPTTGYTDRLFCLYSLNTVPFSAYDIAVFMTNSEGGLYNSFLYPNSTLTAGYMYEDDTKSCLYPAGVQVNYASQSVKNISYNSGFYWDGTSYFFNSNTDVEDPSANYDLKNIISLIITSSEVQNNTDAASREFFIVPDGTVGDEEVYELYFYHSRVTLSQFEYLFNDTYYYDLDKTSIDGVLAKIIDLVGGYKSPDGLVNPLAEVKHFTMYYNPVEKNSEIYFTSSRSIDTLKSFRSEINPIIFTTKDIAYYNATWGETDKEWTAFPDETKNILYVPITDDNGDEITPVVPGSEALLSSTPWEFFTSFLQALMNILVNKIGLLLESILGLGLDLCNILLKVFGENVVTFVLVIVIKAITVLISSVALIFRFIGFIMTLVAIPANSSLLAVDVATNTSGLVFTGLNWGTHFIDGLNFIKAFQWNGLGLWTLFEVFVASLEVVLFVKIVRRHYRTL